MTTDTQTDTFEHGIGLTTLASEKGAVENIREDSPVAIHGVLIPENTVLEGGQGVRHFYTPAMAERAAGVLQQQIDDPDHRLHPLHLVKNFHDIEGQAPADDIIGEVTAVGYSPGVGVVFEAETTDIETANKIQNGYLQVSPSVARGLGQLDEQMEAREVVEFAGARDVAIVGRGQPGVEVNVGPNPAVDALAIDALSRAFNGETDTLSITPEQRELVESAIERFADAQGDATVEDFREWIFQNDDLDADIVTAVESAFDDLFDEVPDDWSVTDEFADWLETDVDTQSPSTSDDGSGVNDATQSTDGPADDVPPDDQPQPDHMSDTDTPSDEEQALLAAVDDPSEAIDVLRDYSSREEPKIIDASNRATIDTDELDTLRESVEQAKQAFAALLAEDSPLSVDALARSDMDALTEPFRDDDGAIDIDTLRQTPETGDTGGGDDPDPDDDGVDVDTLSLGERDDLKRQVRKRQSMLNRDMDKRAGEIEAEIVDTLGAESFEDVEPELEAL